MGYQLRDGVSFCHIVDRYVFLDLVEDRYFGLPDPADQAFGNVVTSGRLSRAETAALGPLCRSGVLRRTDDDARPRACPGMETPRRSLLDERQPALTAETALVLAHRLVAARDARRRPLAGLLDQLAGTKSRITTDAVRANDAAPVAAAFRRAALVMSAHDQCLANSLAVMRRLLARRIPAELVFGVKLRPFQAHCWVQLGDAVVNDRIDTVAMFTPIHVL